MAEHKVPQDVEADDKLIGPFSFRQFCYLMVAFGAGALGYILSQIALPLALLPLPIILFFLAIALPLRKEQPMEIYLSAVARYFLSSKTRLWHAEGEDLRVEVMAPEIIDKSSLVKKIEGEEVSRRLSFLSNISDTRGWSTRGLSTPMANNTNLNDDFANSASSVQDMMDDDSMDDLLDKSNKKLKQNAIDKMNVIASKKEEKKGKDSEPQNPLPAKLASASPLPNYTQPNVEDTSRLPVDLPSNNVTPVSNADIIQVDSSSDVKPIEKDRPITIEPKLNNNKNQDQIAPINQPNLANKAQASIESDNQSSIMTKTSDIISDIKNKPESLEAVENNLGNNTDDTFVDIRLH